MADATGAVGVVGDIAAGCLYFSHRCECLDQVTFTAVILPASGTHHLKHFHDQCPLGGDIEVVRYGHREKLFHNLINPLPVPAGHINADMFHVIFLGVFLNQCGLLFKLHPLNPDSFHRAKTPTGNKGRHAHRQCPAVPLPAAAVGVIPEPDFPHPHRADSKRLPVRPFVIAINTAPDERIQTEGCLTITDKFAHVQIAKFTFCIFAANIINTGELPSVSDSILNGDNLPPRFVGKEHAPLQVSM